jgi:hypothetical protein
LHPSHGVAHPIALFAFSLGVLATVHTGCSAQAWKDLNRELETHNAQQATAERERLAAEDARCASRPAGTYLVGLVSLTASATKPDGTTWDADLRGAEVLIGKAARVGVKLAAGYAATNGVAIPDTIVSWVANKADTAIAGWSKKYLSSLVAPDMYAKATLDNDPRRYVETPYLQDNYALVFDREPLGFYVSMNCDTAPGQHSLVIDVVDKDLMMDDPMFRLTLDPYVIAMAAGDGRKGAVVLARGSPGIGLDSYTVIAMPLGATDVPRVEQ